MRRGDGREVERALEGLAFAHTGRGAEGAAVAEPVGERACPVCGASMVLRQVSGVPVEVCAEHGAWIEGDGLRAIVRRIRQGARPGVLQNVASARLRAPLTSPMLRRM